MRPSVVLASLIPILSACGEGDYGDQEEALVQFIGDNKLGGGADYWIVKGDTIGGPSKIGLIFGYPDDHAACAETVEMMNQRYPSAQFHCEAAN